MMKKMFLTTVTILALTIFTPFSANAAIPQSIAIQEQGDVMPTAEQTQWYVRVNENGQLQKRLWSITYGVWLTDWIDVV